MKVYVVLRHIIDQTEIASVNTDKQRTEELVESLNILEAKRVYPNLASITWECEEHELNAEVL